MPTPVTASVDKLYYTGEVPVGWKKTIDAMFANAAPFFKVEGWGGDAYVGEIVISIPSGASLTFEVDNLGKTRGVVVVNPDSPDLLLGLLGVAKCLRLKLANDNNDVIKTRFNAGMPLFNGMLVDESKLEEMAVLLGLVPSAENRRLDSSATFF